MKKPGFQFIKPYSKGQITIPQEFRKYLNIDEDTILYIAVEDEKLIIKPVREEQINSKYPPQEEQLPTVSGEEYKNIARDVQGSYGDEIVDENKKVREEIEKKLEELAK